MPSNFANWPQKRSKRIVLTQRGKRFAVAAVVLILVGLSALAVSGMGSASGRPPLPPGKPLRGAAMWVWYLPESKDLPGMISKLKESGIRTVLIKSADGTRVWRQFSSHVVDRFHLAGIHVCAWHYVYGSDPLREAQASAVAYKAGAGCFIVNAEVEYKGRSAQAAVYMDRLRSLTSKEWLIGLSSFPYLEYHTDFPYRTFLARGRASVNLPQMYWKEIGRNPDQVVAETYRSNLALGRPVYPIGQTWNKPSPESIRSFQKAVRRAGAPGWSWWEWGSTSRESLQALEG